MVIGRMLNGRLRWVARGLLAAGMASLTLAIGTASAEADVLGALTVNPATGFDDSSITLSTSGPCPQSATQLMVRLTGAGFPSEGYLVVGSTTTTSFATNPSGGYEVPLTDTLRNVAAAQTPPATLTGRYDLTAVCRTSLSSTSLGDFTGSITFTSPTTYVTGGQQTTMPAATTTPPVTTSPPPSESPTPTATEPSETPTTTEPVESPTATEPASGGGQDLGVHINGNSTNPGGSSGSAGPNQLPNTGASTIGLTRLGLALVAAGLVILLAGRRRRAIADAKGVNR